MLFLSILSMVRVRFFIIFLVRLVGRMLIRLLDVVATCLRLVIRLLLTSHIVVVLVFVNIGLILYGGCGI